MDSSRLTVVGAGLFGAVVAHEAAKRGMKVTVVDRRRHVGGRLGSFRYYDMHDTITAALKYAGRMLD